jgi:hypothetical protein
MATVRYTKTFFNEPGRINEETFNSLKRELTRNPNFEIDKDLESFSEHFKTTLRVAGISFIIMITGFSLGEGITTAIGGFAMIAFLGTAFNLLLEGRSYATYVKERKKYFDKMSYAISISNTYYEYIENFYGKK